VTVEKSAGGGALGCFTKRKTKYWHSRTSVFESRMKRLEPTCSLGLIHLPFVLDPILPLGNIFHVSFKYSQELVDVQKFVYVQLKLGKALSSIGSVLGQVCLQGFSGNVCRCWVGGPF